ncbi:MAG TPA: NADH-dependent [FeFe] hydrogenase, group A6 [Clostridia bacterium]|mgnify:FL=1|nr:NADH-dependent [FeFe] hydrogenase, group A6 [Clostridia bacterium]
MSKMISLTIDGIKVEVEQGATVLDAARKANVRIPTLCFLEKINEIGACRMCVVETGARTLQAACVLPATQGMEVKTNTRRVRHARKTVLELILSNHDKKCLSCVRSQNCELQRLALELEVTNENAFAGERIEYMVDDVSPSIVRDNNKCILCRRCVSTCHKIQSVGVIGPVGRGFKTSIETPFKLPLSNTACIGCGQCIASCPVGALREKEESPMVWRMIHDPHKHVVVRTAPAVRAALGEEFGLLMGTNVTGKMVTALRRLGFDQVFDTDFAADLTIMEEAAELVNRIQNKGVLPMITSCSPGWVNYCETFYPEFIPNLSTCKSPHEMMGALIKSYYAEKTGIPTRNLAVVSVMPCTAKKIEADREQLSAMGVPDVDAVITTRELARMIKSNGIDFWNLPDEPFDSLMGESTGAAALFGATGGVMEAALRTAYEIITGETLETLEFDMVRGLEGVKEASIPLGELNLRVAVAHGTDNAKKLLDSIKRGEKQYDFIEIMGCRGGCVDGGGQPFVSAEGRLRADPRKVRARALYRADAKMPLRKSHENPGVQRLYKEFLEKPNSRTAHHLLHTQYAPQKKYRHETGEGTAV